MDALHLLGMVAATDVHAWTGEIVSRHGLKNVVFLPGVEFRDGGGVTDAAGETAGNLHDPAGIRIRQGLQQHCIDHGKNGGVCAYAQGQRGDSDSGEAGTLAEYANGVPQIGQQVVHTRITIQVGEGFHNLKTFLDDTVTFYISFRIICRIPR